MSEPEPGAKAPLLVLEGARLELADGTRLGELNATAEGRRIALIGAWSALFRLLAGEVRLVGGRAQIAGVVASEAVRRGVVGLALHDPPLPRTWTAERYLVESGTLLGWSKSASQRAAQDVLLRFELRHLTTRTLGSLPIVERRALLIAHATLAGPEVLCFEAPLDRLEGEALMYVGARLDRALEAHPALVHFPAPPPLGLERAWIDRADRALAFDHGQVLNNAVARGARALVTVTRHAPAFRAALESRGINVEPAGQLVALLPLLASPEGAELARFLVELPESLDTRGILEASRTAEAPLVELRPLETWS